MEAVAAQSFVCIESFVNAFIALLAVVGISMVSDFWKDSVTHKFPDNGSVVDARELYVDGSPVINKKSARITYGKPAR